MAVLAYCGGDEAAADTGRPVLRSLSAVDGSERARPELPVHGDLHALELLSADPLTVWVEETALRGTHAVLSYARSGRLRATIPTSGPDHDVLVNIGDRQDQFTPAFEARPARGAVVVDGMLIAPAAEPGDIRFYNNGNHGVGRSAEGRLVGYSLTDGRQRWTAPLDDEVTGVAVRGEAVWALAGDTLTKVAASSGKNLDELLIHADTQSLGAQLYAMGDRFVIVNVDGTDRNPPVRVLR